MHEWEGAFHWDIEDDLVERMRATAALLLLLLLEDAMADDDDLETKLAIFAPDPETAVLGEVDMATGVVPRHSVSELEDNAGSAGEDNPVRNDWENYLQQCI